MTPENEALRGELLSAWLDDLRQDRPPRDHPAVRVLAPADVAEVLRLARWHKGVFFPSPPADSPADDLLPEVTDMDHLTSLVSTKGVFMRRVRLARLRSYGGGARAAEAATQPPDDAALYAAYRGSVW